MIDLAEVVLNLGDLLGDAAHKVRVGGIGGRGGVGQEVVDLGLFGLPVAVDAADALFEAVISDR